MKIMVCVKQVPDGDRILVRNRADGGVMLDISDEFRMNRFDEFAVEEAVRIKESMAEATVHVLTVGPNRAAEVLKRPMGMGADAAIHLKTDTDEDPGPAAVAAWIAGYAGPRGYDLVLCGSMSEDGMNGQVGPMTAAYLNFPYATQVIALRPTSHARGVEVERELEAGARDMLLLRLPAVLSLQPGINRPRYPSLSKLLRAHRGPVETVPAEILGRPETRIACIGLMAPQRRRASQILTGSAPEKAERLADLFREKGII